MKMPSSSNIYHKALKNLKPTFPGWLSMFHEEVCMSKLGTETSVRCKFNRNEVNIAENIEKNTLTENITRKQEKKRC